MLLVLVGCVDDGATCNISLGSRLKLLKVSLFQIHMESKIISACPY